MEETGHSIIKSTWDAAGEYLRKHSAALWIEGEDQPYIGSATCIEIENRFFIATAAHNFESNLSYRLYSMDNSNTISIQVIQSNCSQKRLTTEPDIAWLEVDPKTATQARLSGISLESIDPYPKLNANEMYYFTGLPVARKRLENEKRDQTSVVIPYVIYGTPPISESDLIHGDLRLKYDCLAKNLNGPVIMTKPQGMSGGGIWAASGNENSAVWYPNFRLIGIGTTYLPNKNEIRGVRMHHWLELLQNDLPELRLYLSSILNSCQ